MRGSLDQPPRLAERGKRGGVSVRVVIEAIIRPDGRLADPLRSVIGRRRDRPSGSTRFSHGPEAATPKPGRLP